MTFRMIWASDIDRVEHVEIGTLEELLALRDSMSCDLIVGGADSGGERDLWVYDDYME